jgi:hypothetical protein
MNTLREHITEGGARGLTTGKEEALNLGFENESLYTPATPPHVFG